jgi:hypothetical protein
MKFGTVTLAASTLVLAGCTVYFARELAYERERNSAALVESGPDAAALTPPGPESAAATPPGQSAPLVSAAAAPAPDDDVQADAAAGSASVDDTRRARNRKQAEEFLRRYANPETRAKLLKGQVEAHQRIYSALRSELDIDAERFDRLIQLFADRRLDRQVRMARCLTDISCLRPDLVDSAQQRQAIVDLIGEKNTIKLEKYGRDRSRSGEFAGLQARLGPRLALSPQQLDELSSALHDEVKRTRREIESHGHETGAFASHYGIIVYARDTKTVDERMASAAASIDRMRDRASTLLNGEQQTVFEQAQDDALLVFRPFARVSIAAYEQGYELR